jgi:MFS family permease
VFWTGGLGGCIQAGLAKSKNLVTSVNWLESATSAGQAVARLNKFQNRGGVCDRVRHVILHGACSRFFLDLRRIYDCCRVASDRLDVNWVLAGAFFISWAATVATGFAHSFAAVLLARLALGIGESVSWPCYYTVIARNFPERRRGIANAAIAIGIGLGHAM